MRWIKLTAYSILCFCFFLNTASCKKNSENKTQIIFSKTGIVLNSANEVPANASAATGTLDVSYSRETRTLTYKFKWSGLTGNVSVFHIHGLAPAGFSTGVFQTFTASGIIPCVPSGPTSCGSYSGTLLIDGVAAKEQDLLNGLYYVNIHTATNPGGEIRGQITF